MHLANFDFSQERPIEKLLMIGIPPALAEVSTYVTLRLQSLLTVKQPWHTQNIYH
jgi:hypothetical protein